MTKVSHVGKRHKRESAGYAVLFLLFAALLFCLPLQASAKDLITWHHPDFAPSHIVSGPDEGKGITDPMEFFLFDNLPMYKHKLVVSNFKRIISTMAAKQNACSGAILKTPEREKVVEYSVPHLLIHPVRIIIKKGHAKRFAAYKDAEGNYSLVKLLQDGVLSLGYSHGRSYSKALDPIIAKHASKANSVKTARRTILEGLLKMLGRERFDYTLGYAYEVIHFAKLDKDLGKFESLPLSEQKTLIDVYVGCSKTDWGRAAIKEINKVLLKARATKAYYGHYLNWLDPYTAAGYSAVVEERFGGK